MKRAESRVNRLKEKSDKAKQRVREAKECEIDATAHLHQVEHGNNICAKVHTDAVKASIVATRNYRLALDHYTRVTNKLADELQAYGDILELQIRIQKKT